MFLEIVALIILLYVLVKLYWSFYIQRWSHIPSCVKSIPLLGGIPYLVPLNGNDFLLAHIQWLRDSPVCKFWVGARPTILTNNVKVFEAIFNSNTLISKSSNYWMFQDWLGQNILTSTGSIWRKKRKLLTPSFHFHIIGEFLPVIGRHSKSLVNCLKERKGESFEAFKLMKMYTMGVILETSMGFKNDFIAKAFSDVKGEEGSVDSDVDGFLKSIDRILVLLIKRNDIPFYWYKPIFKLFPTGREYYKLIDNVHKFGKKVAEERVIKLGTGQIADDKYAIFMDRMLVNFQKGEISIEDVLNETQTVLFAGYDTVATSLSWCMFMLGSHPEIQKKAFEEAQKIKNMNLPIEEVLKEMKYIECVIKETLRIHPSVPVFSREVGEDVMIDGTLYPKNSILALCILAMQRDEKVWKNALEFKPERFLSLDGQRNPFSFVPFSAGPRNCIGQRFAMNELKLTLYELLLNFEIVSLQKAEELLETIGVVHGVLNENGMKIKMIERLH